MAFDIAKKRTSDDGQWTTLEGFEDAEFCIVRAGDRSVRAGRQEIIKREYARKYAKNKMNEVDSVDLGLKVSAEFILTGWRNIQENGEDVAYSPRKAFEYFESVPELFEAVNDYALDDANYISAEEVAKKSGKSSGKSKA